MTKLKIITLALAGWTMLPGSARAQITNVFTASPPTVLEALESNTGQLLIKGSAPIGSVATEVAVVTVVCKEDVTVSTSHKDHGITLGIKINGVAGLPEDRTIIDYDELDSLIAAMDYISRVSWSVTALSSFDVDYATKAGLHVAAFSSKRAGQIEFSLRTSRMEKRILLAPDQLSQLRSLVDQAKRKLDALRQG